MAAAASPLRTVGDTNFAFTIPSNAEAASLGAMEARNWKEARMARFEPVDPKVSFPELEQRVLEFWREADVFHNVTSGFVNRFGGVAPGREAVGSAAAVRAGSVSAARGRPACPQPRRCVRNLRPIIGRRSSSARALRASCHTLSASPFVISNASLRKRCSR